LTKFWTAVLIDRAFSLELRMGSCDSSLNLTPVWFGAMAIGWKTQKIVY
jgi:hypothetical protein